MPPGVSYKKQNYKVLVQIATWFGKEIKVEAGKLWWGDIVRGFRYHVKSFGFYFAAIKSLHRWDSVLRNVQLVQLVQNVQLQYIQEYNDSWDLLLPFKTLSHLPQPSSLPPEATLAGPHQHIFLVSGFCVVWTGENPEQHWERLASGTLFGSASTWTNTCSSNKIQRNYKGLKITVCMWSWGKFYTKKTHNDKKKRNPTATSEELEQKQPLGAKAKCRACPLHSTWPPASPLSSPHRRNQLTLLGEQVRELVTCSRCSLR